MNPPDATALDPASVRRGSAHPPLGRRTPARAEDFFDEASLAELRGYVAPLRRVAALSGVVVLAIELLATFVLDLGPAVAEALDGWPWPLRLLGVVAVFGLIGEVLGLPAAWWSTMVHDRRHGLSEQSGALWAGDQVLGAILGVAVTGIVLVPIYVAIRSVEMWWLLGGGAVAVVIVFLQLIYPVAIMPWFNRFTPMPEGALRTRIEAIAALAGTRIEGVYTMDGSRRSRRGNAFVAGFGPTTRVVVYDTMLDFPEDQLAQVVAHEIGHHRLGHLRTTLPLAAAQVLVALAFVQYVAGTRLVLGWAGVEDLGDPGSAPIVLGGLGVAMGAQGALSAWVSRRNERAADLEALELLGDPSAFLALWPSLVARNKADLEPSWWRRLTASHPDPPERMQFGLQWAEMNQVPVEVPDRAVVATSTSS